MLLEGNGHRLLAFAAGALRLSQYTAFLAGRPRSLGLSDVDCRSPRPKNFFKWFWRNHRCFLLPYSVKMFGGLISLSTIRSISSSPQSGPSDHSRARSSSCFYRVVSDVAPEFELPFPHGRSSIHCKWSISKVTPVWRSTGGHRVVSENCFER